MSVRKLLETYDDRMKDHFVTWSILQLMPAVLNKSSDAEALFPPDLLRLIRELREKKYIVWKPHEEELVHYNSMFIMNRLKNMHVPYLTDNYTNKHVETWWSAETESGSKLDYYKLEANDFKNIFFISSYLTRPMATSIMEFLQADHPVQIS
ncbi:hypothetical protein AKO1_012372, partial [Acrasis kona]